MGVVTRSKKQNSGKTVSNVLVPLSPSTISRTSIDRLQKLRPSTASKKHFEKAAGQVRLYIISIIISICVLLY